MNIDKDFLRIAMDNLGEAHPAVRDYVELLEREIRKLQGENSHWLRNIQYLSQRLAFAASWHKSWRSSMAKLQPGTGTPISAATSPPNLTNRIDQQKRQPVKPMLQSSPALGLPW
ncbi:hypothetical protein SynBIOSE41_01366 [Synechococcus sp. BIOS-E4-1]|uniref:hypothetical protein n=1 Tax=Synechococcus sp. BIOS-E4-1 TaxID=1400864 RepID=UPI0016452A6A|nr:hypothetical protein [Synechococcus sp. BIOS-E4-1]QNI53882.1 hypothetical protein SynBIOSE41_01366 [Synechococcus sp. BIOS-E4-1]